MINNCYKFPSIYFLFYYVHKLYNTNLRSIVSIIDFYAFFPVSYTLYFVMLLSLLFLLCDDVQGNKTKEKNIYLYTEMDKNNIRPPSFALHKKSWERKKKLFQVKVYQLPKYVTQILFENFLV